jgi:hypothetical protein
MASADLIQEQDELEHEHLGGGRFNRLLGVVFVTVAMLGGVALALGVQSSGIGQTSPSQKSADDPSSAARDRGEIEDLAAHGAEPHAAPTVMPTEPVMPISQAPVQPHAAKPPSRYALSRLIGAYQNASTYGQQRVQIAWRRLIFPNTLEHESADDAGADQSGYAGFSDQIDRHYLATFGNRRRYEPDQRRPGHRTDGHFWRRRFLRTVRLLPTESMGDGESNRRFSRLRTIRGAGSANDGTGIKSSTDD